MRIIAVEPVVIEVTHRGDWVFCLVHTDEGITGLGEASHGLNDALAVAAIHQHSSKLVGQDPRQIRRLRTLMSSAHAGRAVRTAQSGLEQALWDILGQSLGVPIRTLLGGAVRDDIRLYANINRHVRDRSPEGFARAAASAVGEGFTAVKLAPFDELVSPDHTRTGPQAAWRTGVARVEAVREAIGDSIDLMVDCHGRMDASEAIQVGQALSDCDLMWYEEPVPHNFHDELARVTDNVPMPTASAESVYGVEGFAPFLRSHLVDVIMPDVKHDGGIAETMAICEAARMRKMLVAPHNPAGPVSTAATAQVVATLPNLLILEYAWGEVPWRGDLVAPPEKIVDGRLKLSDRPGLGHCLNPEVVAAHRRSRASQADASKVVITPQGA